MKWLLIPLSVLLASLPLNANAQLVVVMSKNSPQQTLSENHIANIFLARTNRFPDGQKAKPVELKNASRRANFYQSISGKSLNQLAAYWTTLVFTGKGKPPKGIKDIESLITLLERYPGAISYVDSSQVTTDMKIIFRFPEIK